MAEPIIGSLITKVAASLAVSGIKAAYAKLIPTPAFKRAVEETKNAFPQIELGPALAKWCESEQFQKLVQAIKLGEGPPTDKLLIESFISVTDFYAGVESETHAAAEAVLRNFFEKLEGEIIRSPDGLVAVASRQEILHEETRDVIRQDNQRIGGQLEGINSALIVISASLPDKSTSDAAVEDKIFNARVDEARKLLEAGKAVTARDMLLSVRKDIAGKNRSSSLLFRIATNLGSCAIQLHDLETAKSETQFALALEPDNPKALANAACAAYINGKFEEALNLATNARARSPKDSVATANFIQALFGTGRKAEVETLLTQETWIKDDADCCFALGGGFFDSGQYSESEQAFRFAVKKKPEDSRALLLLAHTLIRPTQTAFLNEPILRWRVAAEFSTKLGEAHELLSTSITILEQQEDSRMLAFARILRADVRRMLDDNDGAIADCNAAITDPEQKDIAHHIKALCYFSEQRFKDAIDSFEKISLTKLQERVVIPLAVAYLQEGKADAVVKLLGPYWVESTHPVKLVETADLLLTAYDLQGNSEEAEKFVLRLRTDLATNPDALMAVGLHRRREGKNEEATGLMSEALAYAKGAKRDFIALELANLYYANNNFAKAADLYGAVPGFDSNTDIARRYLVCLFNSAAHKAALDLAQRLRKNGEPIPVISHVEAKVLMEIGDLPAAQTLLERLAELNPKEHHYKIEVVECALRRNQTGKARELLQKLLWKDIKTDAKVLLRAAELRSLVGMGEVLEYAYQARRIGFSDPDVHARYTTVFLRREEADSTKLNRDTFELDCSIILEVSEGKTSYTLLDENDLHPEHGEISNQQATEMKLVGKKKGDRFVLRKTPWNEVECVVVEVQSKYVRAFQETLEKFPSLFPTETLIQPIQGTYESFKDGLLKQLDRDQDATRKIVSVYEQKRITIEFMAQLGNRSIIETWGALIGGHNGKFLASSGQIERGFEEVKLLAQGEELVLELTGVLLLAQLGLLPRLAKAKRLCTTQAVIDQVLEVVAQSAFSKPGLSFGKIGDAYVKDEITAELLAMRKQFLESIRDFLLSHVSIVPVRSSLEVNGSELLKLKQALGTISLSCVLAARERSALLYSDDEVLRAVALHEWGVQGVWSQSVLQLFLATTLMTEEEYSEAVCKMVLLNYKFVSLNVQSIMWALRKSEFKVSSDVKAIVAVFRGPECTLESAAAVLAEVMKRLWLETAFYETKLSVLDEILEALTTGRPIKPALELFAFLIKAHFFLMSTAEQAINRQIELWQKRQMSRAGLIYLPPSKG